MGTYNRRFLWTVAISLLASISSADDKSYPMSVNTAVAGESAASAPATGMVSRSGLSTVRFKLNNSCFATNLRGVANPIAPTSIITSTVTINISGTDYTFSANYPGELSARNGGMTAATSTDGLSANNFFVKVGDENGSVVSGSNAAILGNAVLFNTSIPATASVDSTGAIVTSAPGEIYLKKYSFNQTVTTCAGPPVYGSYGVSTYIPAWPCSAFMGQNGALTANVGGLSISSDRTLIELNVAFPGQTGFCGGFYSPLMVFFDDARPKFTNASTFPLNVVGRTAWPEANSPGWFVAIDDGTGLVTKKEQLFGNTDDVKNGFEALRALDSNHDGVIDSKDKSFKKLVLWRDINGDGISQKKEIVRLSSKITKISLKYDKDTLKTYGAYAQERERGNFWFKDGKGKIKKGDIIDIWLAPPPPTRVTQK